VSGADELRLFWRRALVLAAVIILGLAAGLYAGVAGSLMDGRAAAYGWLLGSAVSVLRFALTYRTLQAGIAPGRLIRVRLFNYALSAAALVLAFACRPTINPLAAAVGLLAMNAAVVLAEVLFGGKALDSSPPADDNP
jgi:hypothetical protein